MSQHKMNIQDIIFLMMYIFIYVYLFIKMLMTSCFVCATLNLGRKKSTGTEPMLVQCLSGTLLPQAKYMYNVRAQFIPWQSLRLSNKNGIQVYMIHGTFLCNAVIEEYRIKLN